LGKKNPNPRRLRPVLLLEHKGRMIWRAPHDRERIWLVYHYRLDCFDYGGEFDVRDLPGYTEFPRFNFDAAPEPWIDAHIKWMEAQQQHHVAIIRAALDGGHEPVTVKGAI
jgi:hypothetical protein